MMAADGDMQAHRATYARVIGMLKYGGIACGLIAFGVILLISSK